MRRRLFGWHLALGKYAGVLILIWATSGAVMTLQPLFLRAVGPGFPRLAAEPLAPAAFSLPPSRVVPRDATAVALRQFAGRSWYEVTKADGSVLAYDARSGRPAASTLASQEVLETLSRRLAASRWTPRTAAFMDRYDDQYRKGRLPVYKVALAGPGRVILYVSARDGNVESVTTRWSRLVRWLGLGIHTWNFAAVMRGHDDERGLLLCCLVALPLASLALVALTLLLLRRRALKEPRTPGVRQPGERAKASLAAVVALALLCEGPARPACAALAQQAPAGIPVVLPTPLPLLGSLPAVPSAALAPLNAAPLRPLAAGLEAAPTVAAAALPAPVAALSAVKAMTLAPRTSRTSESPEQEAQAHGRAFDGARPARPGGDTIAEGGASFSAPLAAPSDRAWRAPSASIPPEPHPPGPNRKALWGLYLTQAVHMASLSLLWRIAWPLMVLNHLGRGGLGMVDSVEQIADMALGIVSGMIVDRLLPRGSMVAASLARAGVGAALAAAALWFSPATPFLLGVSLVHVLALSVLYIGQAAVSPAAAGDDKEALQRLNIVLKLVSTAVAIPASLAGGWLVARAGIATAFLGYIAVNALVLAPMYRWLFPRDMARAKPVATSAKPAAGWREVLKFIRGEKVILALLAATATAMILAEPLRNTVAPIVVKELLRGGAALLGKVMTAFYAGQIAGSLVLWKWSKRVAPARWVQLAMLGFGSFWLLALAPQHRVFLYLAVGLMAFFVQPAATAIKTLLQREVAERRPDLLGRVMSVHLMVYALAVAGETALIGWVFSSLTGSFFAPILALGIAFTALAGIVWLVSRAMSKNQKKP